MPDRCLGRLDRYRNGEFAFGDSLERAPRRRHIGIVAADRGADVALAGRHVVGGIEANPAERRQIDFHPGMSGVRLRAVLILRAVMQIARDVTRRNAQRRAIAIIT